MPIGVELLLVLQRGSKVELTRSVDNMKACSEERSVRSSTDWESIHRKYRAGLLSLREIGAEHHVSHTAIRKRARRDGWERDLSARIRARADALVARIEVANEVSTEMGVVETEVVEANAQAIMQIRSEHRSMIARGLRLSMRLLDDLQTIGDSLPLLERLVRNTARSAGLDDKETERWTATVRKSFNLAARAGMLKMIVDVIARFIALERQEYGLDAASHGGAPGTPSQLTELLQCD